MSALEQISSLMLVSKEDLLKKCLFYLKQVWGTSDAKHLSTKEQIVHVDWEMVKVGVAIAEWDPKINYYELLSKVTHIDVKKIRALMISKGTREDILALVTVMKKSITDWADDVVSWHVRMDISSISNQIQMLDFQDRFFELNGLKNPVSSKFVLSPTHLRILETSTKVENPFMSVRIRVELALVAPQKQQVAHYLHQGGGRTADLIGLLDSVSGTDLIGMARWQIQLSKEARAVSKEVRSKFGSSLTRIQSELDRYGMELDQQSDQIQSQIHQAILAGKWEEKRKQSILAGLVEQARQEVFGCSEICRLAQRQKGS